jgi:hypothetical protein
MCQPKIEKSEMSQLIADAIYLEGKRPPPEVAASDPTTAGALLKLGRNTAKRRIQLGAEAVHGRDDRDRDASRDETVLDRGGTRFVL